MEGLVPAHAFYVVSTHLSSGPEKELRRIAELRSVWPQASGYPEIWCLDANTELDFADPRCLRGNACAVPQHANALRTFLREREPLRSVWEASANYGGPSASGAGSPAAAGGAPVSAQRPVSVWKMRGASSDQVSKMGEDAYSLIDHVFYWGGRLFNRGALALDLREHSAAGESNANRDWLALLPNEVVPSDHLPIVWDFELSVAPRLSLPALINNAAALLRPLVVEHERTLSSSALLDTTVIADSLDSAQRLLARYEGELKAQAEPREFVSSPNSQRDSAMRNRPFDDPRWPTRLDAEAWHILGNEDAFSNLPNRGTLPDGKRRTLREAMFHQSGCLQQLWALLSSKSSKSSYKECARHVAISTACLLLGGCFFARDDLSPKSNNLLALASLRCIFRAIDGGSKKFEAPVDMASMTPFDKALLERRPTDTWLYALAGQVTECLLERSLRFGESHTSGALFWRTGRSHIIDIYELLCHGGGDAGATRVGGALDALINEAEYLLSTHDDQNEIAALCALSSVRWHASGSGRCAARVVAMVVGMIQERPHTFGLRSMHEQVAMRALKQVALSPNIDTGGGLDVLVMALNDHMHTLASDPEHAAKQARALARPAPHAALAFIRSAASVLCGKVPVDRLLVVSQKLQAHGDGASARSRPRGAAVGGAGSVVCDVGSAVEQLARSLRYLGIGVDGTTEAKTVGYILKVLCEVAKHAEGQRTLLTIFLEDRLGTFLSVLTFLGALGVDDPERWRAHLRALQLLNALLRAPETGSSRVVEAFHRRFLADARGRTELHDLATRSLDDSSWSLTDGPPDVARLLRDVAAATQTLLTVCRQRPLAAAGAAAVESREAESFFPDDDAFPADELRGASLLNSSSHFGTDTHPPDSP
ncbi:hypothetical protein M885DRAFT_518858 [Pelagophyceae sp. CCMP2097]|nr:hypothetical protein M885DRAFT_518858 [Pelagophyceae sp. CCMP2097]|mmetsp:Transcript_17730/g.60877  ORF Transcript_17730/g.60877 Transcript_17730/m.60877 type:complete len:884 (+) Transcript_17730:1321-3972(+)